MAQGEQFTCPCGFSIISADGREDMMKHVMLHKNGHHADMKMNDKETESLFKKVEVHGTGPKNVGSMPKEGMETPKPKETTVKHNP